MHFFETASHLVSAVLDRVAQAALAAMVLLVCVNILLRLVWRPLPGTYELVSLLGAVVISLALGYCAVQKGYVAIGLLVDRLSQRTQACFDIVIHILSAGIFGVMAWQSCVLAGSIRASGEVLMTTQLPAYPVVYGIGFGFAVLCLVLLMNFCKSAARVGGK